MLHQEKSRHQRPAPIARCRHQKTWQRQASHEGSPRRGWALLLERRPHAAGLNPNQFEPGDSRHRGSPSMSNVGDRPTSVLPRFRRRRWALAKVIACSRLAIFPYGIVVISLPRPGTATGARPHRNRRYASDANGTRASTRPSRSPGGERNEPRVHGVCRGVLWARVLELGMPALGISAIRRQAATSHERSHRMVRCSGPGCPPA